MKKIYYAISCLILLSFPALAQKKTITPPKTFPTKLPPDATTHGPVQTEPLSIPNLTLMTYNSRAAWLDKGKGDHDWFKRRDAFLKTILQYRPDILCTQEENNIQHEWLENELKKHAYGTIGLQSSPNITVKEALTEIITVDPALVLKYQPQAIINGGASMAQYVPQLSEFLKKASYGNSLGEYTAIYYNKDRLKLIDKDERIWLDNIKSKPKNHSILDKNLYNWLKSWKGNRRIYTRGYFQDNLTGKKFTVINTHLSLNPKERTRQAKQIISDTNKYITQHPGNVFIMGDFNADATFIKNIFIEYKDSKSLAQKIIGPQGTFTDWGKIEGRIDFIIAQGPVTIHTFATVQQMKNEKEIFPSDHRPVVVTAEIN